MLGRSLIELLGVLAIIGLLSIAGLFGFRIAMNYYKANETIHDVMLRATNVPMMWDDYDTNTAYLNPFEFMFADLKTTNRVGYPVHTMGEPNGSPFVFRVEVSNISKEVCERILGLKPTSVDLIEAGADGFVPTRTTAAVQENCAAAGLMYFFFDDIWEKLDPDNPVGPENPDACVGLTGNALKCCQNNLCCDISPPAPSGCREPLYDSNGCLTGYGADQSIQIAQGQCCDGLAISCCPLTDTCTPCEPNPCCQNPECCNSTDPCCGSTDECCGNADPCACNPNSPCCTAPNSCACQPNNECCDSTDACCGSTDECCGNEDPCACNPNSPCCTDPNGCACSPNAKCCSNPASCTCEERGGTQIISGYGDAECCAEPTYCCSADAGCSPAGACTPGKCCGNTCGLCSPCDDATGACVPIECGECQECNPITGGCELVPDCPFCSPSANSYDGTCPTGGLGGDALLTPVNTINGVGIACCRTCTVSSSPYHSVTALLNSSGIKQCCYGEAGYPKGGPADQNPICCEKGQLALFGDRGWHGAGEFCCDGSAFRGLYGAEQEQDAYIPMANGKTKSYWTCCGRPNEVQTPIMPPYMSDYSDRKICCPTGTIGYFERIDQSEAGGYGCCEGDVQVKTITSWSKIGDLPEDYTEEVYTYIECCPAGYKVEVLHSENTDYMMDFSSATETIECCKNGVKREENSQYDEFSGDIMFSSITESCA